MQNKTRIGRALFFLKGKPTDTQIEAYKEARQHHKRLLKSIVLYKRKHMNNKLKRRALNTPWQSLKIYITTKVRLYEIRYKLVHKPHFLFLRNEVTISENVLSAAKKLPIKYGLFQRLNPFKKKAKIFGNREALKHVNSIYKEDLKALMDYQKKYMNSKIKIRALEVSQRVPKLILVNSIYAIVLFNFLYRHIKSGFNGHAIFLEFACITIIYLMMLIDFKYIPKSGNSKK
ncbi:hypothetical protein [Pseudomonas sp.]|uniref:hypothetical protein n=1 Tax=Pseudomonas sp. TaxID=306 RepID=UPI00258E7538|nr:hypothetical protein [Pseudomonas sp.]